MLDGAVAPSTSKASLRRRFAVGVLAREVFVDAARVLGQRGIAVMPLKGVLLQHALYEDPIDRLVSDVDVLVPEAQFEPAIAALVEAGFAPDKIGKSLIEVSLRSRKGLAIDLHRQLFSGERYALSSASMFRRASLDRELFGVAVHIAHAYDTAAHLLGKFVSDHAIEEAAFRLGELRSWAARARIDPTAFARHLHAIGMGRAGRFALRCGERRVGGEFFSAALRALPRDRVGAVLARVSGAFMPHLNGTALAALPAHLLNTSLPRAGASLTHAAVNRLRHPGEVQRRALGDVRWLECLSKNK